MSTLHVATARQGLLNRIESLRADTPRQWGVMSADQMLHHLNAALEMMLGRLAAKPKTIPLPKSLLKFFTLNLPWPKGAPTAPELVARERYDFESERARLKGLIEEISNKPLAGHWLDHPVMGQMSGLDCTRLQYKHIDHHLRQFGQ